MAARKAPAKPKARTKPKPKARAKPKAKAKAKAAQKKVVAIAPKAKAKAKPKAKPKTPHHEKILSGNAFSMVLLAGLGAIGAAALDMAAAADGVERNSAVGPGTVVGGGALAAALLNAGNMGVASAQKTAAVGAGALLLPAVRVLMSNERRAQSDNHPSQEMTEDEWVRIIEIRHGADAATRVRAMLSAPGYKPETHSLEAPGTENEETETAAQVYATA